ncbi:MAG: shikimate kinase [Bacteroidetes bacterium]|nr:shikimate kinase [Bacteroidota bacterium]MCL5025890.1 shikimate kinase [Chloroflexota bacterium]
MTNLVLTGFMATGKTSVGQRAAQRLGLRFVDMDAVIEERAGKPIARIFAEDGETVFRDVESALARELAAQSGLVVATGGGCMLRPQNCAALGKSGVVVCLWAEPEEVLRRAGADTTRPLLPKEGVERTRSLLEQRRRAYQALPHHVETTGLTVDEVVERVVELYEAEVARRVPSS